MAEAMRPFGEIPKPGAFESKPYYSREGDCLFWYFRPDESYAERIDSLLTVYRAFDGDKIVGVQIKGIRLLIRTIRALLQPQTIKLKHVLLAANRQAGTPTDRYEPIARESGELSIAPEDWPAYTGTASPAVPA